MANIAAAGRLSLKGTAPVNTCGDTGCSEQQVDGGTPFVSYLDHDHRERENIRFLAVGSLLLQYLWCGPSRSMTLIIRGASDGIQVLSDRSKAEIRDPRMVGVIHENIRLLRVKTIVKTGHKSITYSFEISMDYVAGVEEVKAFSDIG